jgi:two-component system nitrogen regulation sensor histidine kinase GlnL
MMTLPDSRAAQLIENIYPAVLVFDSGLRLQLLNAAGENLLSVSARKVKGQQVFEFLPEAPRFAEMLQRSLLTRRPYTERGMELRLGQGRSVTVDAMVTPVLDDAPGGELIVELVDVQSFARVRREEQLLELHEAARKSLEGVAHEIKNPLGGLRGAAQLLERELNGSALTEYTRIIIDEADRLRVLVDRMLTPNGRQRLGPVNIHELLDYVQNVVEAEVEDGLLIERDYDPSLPALTADRDQLIQVLLNIVRNAAQAAGTRGRICLRTRIKRNATIRQQQHKLAIQIEVIDDGPGIRPELAQEIFYPMVTTRADGMGLGLSIAQSLVHAHGGSIEYERVGTETVFRILLPLE